MQRLLLASFVEAALCDSRRGLDRKTTRVFPQAELTTGKAEGAMGKVENHAVNQVSVGVLLYVPQDRRSPNRGVVMKRVPGISGSIRIFALDQQPRRRRILHQT